jgi:hypothetical protein
VRSSRGATASVKVALTVTGFVPSAPCEVRPSALLRISSSPVGFHEPPEFVLPVIVTLPPPGFPAGQVALVVNVTLTWTLSSRMLLVDSAVIVHGKLLPTASEVHTGPAPKVVTQCPPNDDVVTSSVELAAAATVTPNDELVHDDTVAPNPGRFAVKPTFGDVTV